MYAIRSYYAILADDAAFVPVHWQNLSWGAKKNVGVEGIINPLDLPHYGDLKVGE